MQAATDPGGTESGLEITEVQVQHRLQIGLRKPQEKKHSRTTLQTLSPW